ncbi:HlyD family efflux transporter periplasmic adaptor subunit [Rheinheimera soli]|uniref:HlyD family secretion protein n=1 Tax=Rheinheimera soli TaxID=443616 RepID=A0ABU1W5R8_9GAMM|nr:HlyD family efflux transporter periplasmic adaptor subunit [Rheinheimera soli]MDR7123083.1 HlyD family secretion protein [Rheinheimera soli]
MDRVIRPSARKFLPAKIIVTVAIVVSMILGYQLFASDSRVQQQYVARNSVKIVVVKQGVFNENLNVRGILTPKKTVYLDAISGGVVEEKIVERGAYVKVGEPLIRLSNTALQLEVISREAQITEQLNFLRNTQINADTAALDLEREILDTNNQILTTKRNLKKFKQLSNNGYVEKNSIEELEQNLDYFERRSELNSNRKAQQEKIRSIQLRQLEESAVKLEENLKFARKSLDNLLIAAPVSGYLSELDIEIGELKASGSRLGQIDIPGSFKIVASLDEYYLNAIQVGMPVKFQIEKTSLESQVSKVDSRVNLGQFLIEVDIQSIPKQELHQIKRGQSLELAITLGNSVDDTLLLDKGAFYASTGGNWVFVLDKDGNTATRRNIQIGMQNRQFYQVIDGLELGDKVITSSYQTFNNADEIILN